MSVALGGAMVQGLDAPRLRGVLRDILNGERTRPARHARRPSSPSSRSRRSRPSAAAGRALRAAG